MNRSDPNLYDYWPYRDRPKIVWPGGKSMAFWIAPNIEFYEFDPPVNSSRPGWPRPAPTWSDTPSGIGATASATGGCRICWIVIR